MNIELDQEQLEQLIVILETASNNSAKGATQLLGELQSQLPEYFKDLDI
jgi:hypothetical protein